MRSTCPHHESAPNVHRLAFEHIHHRYPTLTPRLFEVWVLLARSLSNRGIAAELGLQPKWIDNAVGLLYGALDITTSDSDVTARVRAVLLYACEDAGRQRRRRDDAEVWTGPHPNRHPRVSLTS